MTNIKHNPLNPHQLTKSNIILTERTHSKNNHSSKSVSKPNIKTKSVIFFLPSLPNASRVVQETLFEAFGNLEAKNITFSIFVVYNVKFEIIQILD